MPSLAPWTDWQYGENSQLFLGRDTIISQRGVQQGDPLGPLLFSLAVHPVALQLAQLGRGGNPGRKLDLCMWYLDDGVLAGDVEAVSEALTLLHNACPGLGLTLELSKSELVVLSGIPRPDLHNFFPAPLLVDQNTGACRVLKGNFDLLGARGAVLLVVGVRVW